MSGRGHRLAAPVFCRTLLAQVELAESFTMAEWLTVRADGRTVKEAFAEAARLAWEMDKHLGGPEAKTPIESPPGTQPKERERRPALVLTRELRECLGRVQKRLEAEPVPTAVGDALYEMGALFAGTAAPTPGPPSSSLRAAGAGEGSLG